MTLDSEGQPSRPRVLTLEPDAALGRAIERVLAGPYEVVVVPGLAAALARLVRGERFDAVVCEARLPGADAAAVHAAVTAVAPALATRFVFLAGSDAPGVARLAAPLLAKPFDATTLRALVAARVAG